MSGLLAQAIAVIAALAHGFAVCWLAYALGHYLTANAKDPGKLAEAHFALIWTGIVLLVLVVGADVIGEAINSVRGLSVEVK